MKISFKQVDALSSFEINRNGVSPGGGKEPASFTHARKTEENRTPAEPAEKFTSTSSGEKYNYTVISFLGANLMSSTGATQEAKEYIESLAPQIKDDSLALVMLGTIRDDKDGKYHVKRYEVTSQGVKDTTEEIHGSHYVKYDGDDRPIESEKAAGDKVSPFHRDTLKEFISYSMKKFPAEHYILSFSTHGSSVKGLAGDKNRQFSGWIERFREMDNLDLPALTEVLEENRRETGRKMDIVDFDACLMGQVEVVNGLKNEADYIIASPAVEQGFGPMFLDDKNYHTVRGVNVPRSGHQQVEVFERILKDPGVKPEDLAADYISINAVEGRVREEKNGKEMVYDMAPTLSAYSTKGIDRLNGVLDRMGADLQKRLEKKEAPEDAPKEKPGFFKSLMGSAKPPQKTASDREKIFDAITETNVFYNNKGEPYLDFQDFAGRIASRFYSGPEEKNFATEISSALDEAALATFKGVLQRSDANDRSGKPEDALTDYSKFGNIGVFLPGGRDNKFTSEMKTSASRTSRMLKNEKDSYEFCKFWENAGKESQEIGLTPKEQENVKQIISGLDKLSEIDYRREENKYQAEMKKLHEFLTDEKMQEAGARKIWEYNFSKTHPALDCYKRTENIPPAWKSFVLSVVNSLMDEAFA
jgi:hypothetical protein